MVDRNIQTEKILDIQKVVVVERKVDTVGRKKESVCRWRRDSTLRCTGQRWVETKVGRKELNKPQPTCDSFYRRSGLTDYLQQHLLLAAKKLSTLMAFVGNLTYFEQ